MYLASSAQHTRSLFRCRHNRSVNYTIGSFTAHLRFSHDKTGRTHPKKPPINETYKHKTHTRTQASTHLCVLFRSGPPQRPQSATRLLRNAAEGDLSYHRTTPPRSRVPNPILPRMRVPHVRMPVRMLRVAVVLVGRRQRTGTRLRVTPVLRRTAQTQVSLLEVRVVSLRAPQSVRVRVRVRRTVHHLPYFRVLVADVVRQLRLLETGGGHPLVAGCRTGRRIRGVEAGWISALPASLVIIGWSFRVAKVYTWPVSEATSSITWVPVRVESS